MAVAVSCVQCMLSSIVLNWSYGSASIHIPVSFICLLCAFGVKLLLKLISGIRILVLGNVCFATPAKRLIIFCSSEGLLLSLLLSPKD